MKRRKFICGAALCAAAGLWIGGAFAATCAGMAPAEILHCVNDRLEREFISHDGLLLDYVGEIPTAEEIADLKPNAMGWWCPIENGSMFTGEWLPALMAEGVTRKALVEKCVRGLIKMSEVSDVPGFIARGTGTDGKSHHPCGSNAQTPVALPPATTRSNAPATDSPSSDDVPAGRDGGIIVTWDTEGDLGDGIRAVPVWKWCLEC